MPTLARLRDLEQRYDGPIPAQHREDAEMVRRRRRGHAAVLESQALAFLEAAVRCETEIEELIDDLGGQNGAQCQQESWARQLGTARARLTAHIACAAEAINCAAEKRGELALPPHPLVRLAQLVENRSNPPRAKVAPNK